jgi:hypothetical protein
MNEATKDNTPSWESQHSQLLNMRDQNADTNENYAGELRANSNRCSRVNPMCLRWRGRN